MNAALAVLLPLAARHWISRLLTCTALLATLLIAGQLTQPPWWDNSADIREMVDFMENGTGHEGVDEYVPAGADASELNKDLPRVSDEHGKPVPSKILVWEPATRHFQIHAKPGQNIVVRLFNYPAWQAAVNGKPVITGKTETTGLMVIPIKSGENDVYINFGRTTDRLAGIVVSMMSITLLALFVTVWRNPQRAKPYAKPQSTTQEN
jgi:hypothetical protein